MNSPRGIYLDHAASSPVLPAVAERLAELYRRGLGNSASVHRAGVGAATELEKARCELATVVGADPDELHFTSGATESNNLIISGALKLGSEAGRNELVVSTIEHSSVLEAAKASGAIVRYLDVNRNGLISHVQLNELVGMRTALVSVLHANNETGTLQNLHAIGDVCRRSEVLFHSDGAQALCKVSLDLRKTPVDFYTFSGHKIHGPKGIGGLYVRAGVVLPPLFHGGRQENGLRPGTVPVELAIAMATATHAFTADSRAHLANLKKRLQVALLESFPSVRFHGHESQSLPNILNFALPGGVAKDLLVALDARGIRASAGSACQSGKKTASHVLLALGLSETQAFEAIRVSWGIDTGPEEIDELVRSLRAIHLTSPSEA